MIKLPRLASLDGLFRSAVSLASLSLLALGCEEYDGAPRPSIEGAEGGVLSDTKAPFVVAFDKPVEPASVRVKVVRSVLDEEGFLADEVKDSKTELDLLFAYDAKSEADLFGGTAELTDENTRLVIQPDEPFPLAEKLMLLVEPDLADTRGHETIVRERIPFSYDAKLNCAPSDAFKSGAYFFLANVDNPIAVQVQLLAYIEVNPETGEFVGEFVNADRNLDPKPCEAEGLSCDDTQACRTLPAPACVAPSEKAASADEYPDYFPNYELPYGYHFRVKGCVDGQSGDKTLFKNIPVDVVVSSPKVTLKATLITASFAAEADGVVRGSGNIAAEQVLLGTIDSGKADGTMIARSIPDDEIPKGLKKPEPEPEP